MAGELKEWEVIVVKTKTLIYRVQAVNGGDATAQAVGKAFLERHAKSDGVEVVDEGVWQMTGLEEVHPS